MDKDRLKRQHIFNLLSKTTKMFTYKNLPDTIPIKDLETILQIGGFAIFQKVDGKLYCFSGGLGGEPNPYYLPTIAVVANPALKYNDTLKIDKECVVMLNDSYYQGLIPLMSKYINMLTEAEITLVYATLNARIPALISADTDNTAESAKDFIQKIYDGKEYGIVTAKVLSDGLKSFSFNANPNITQIIEAIQYIRGTMYNELGLRASYNMKREALSEHEIQSNDDILFPLVDDMLEMRKIGIEKVNAMFGTNIEVELNSSWETIAKERELSVEMAEKEVAETGGDDVENNGNADEARPDETSDV